MRADAAKPCSAHSSLAWLRDGPVTTPEPNKSLEHFYFSLQAAAAGLGVAIGPWALVQQEVEAGLLVAPFGFLEDGTGYHLLRPSRMGADRRVEALIAWLRASA